MIDFTDARQGAAEHTKRLASVDWVKTRDLADRWGVSRKTVRKIPRAKLPYLPFGKRGERRYDPRDVELYEMNEKRAAEESADAEAHA
jgi:hypothetical protein